MAIISCKYAEQDRGISIDQQRNRTYTLTWKVITDVITVPGTGPTTHGQAGLSVLVEAWNTAGLPAGSDPVPAFGVFYSYLGATDTGSYAQQFSCKLENIDTPNIWIIEVQYAAPRNDSKEEKNKLEEPNPLDWATVYWIEWVEDTVPVEIAHCLTDLVTIERGPSFPANEPGPIVNGAGQQTVDPVTKPEFRPILCARQNYEVASTVGETRTPFGGFFVAPLLNQEFRDTVNHDVFLGAPAGSWRYLVAQADEPKVHKIIDGAEIEYVAVTVKLEFKGPSIGTSGTGTGAGVGGNYQGWDRVILNNGQVCFRTVDSSPGSVVLDPRSGEPMLFPTVVYTTKDDLDVSELPSGGGLTLDDLVEVESAEPVNLTARGFQIFDPETDANHIRYRHYDEADYTPDTFTDGTLTFKSPWKEILELYEEIYG